MSPHMLECVDGLILIGSHFNAMAALHLSSCSSQGDHGVLPLALARECRSSNADDHRFWAIELVPGDDSALVRKEQRGGRETEG
jgi:hypothetical protein